MIYSVQPWTDGRPTEIMEGLPPHARRRIFYPWRIFLDGRELAVYAEKREDVEELLDLIENHRRTQELIHTLFYPTTRKYPRPWLGGEYPGDNACIAGEPSK